MADTAAPTAEQVAAFYDRTSHLVATTHGDNLHLGYWTGPEDDSSLGEAAERLTRMMMDRLHVRPGERVLDIGCGVGTPAIRLAQQAGADVVGITVSRSQVEQATRRAELAEVHEQVRFRHADAMHLPFPDGSFDAVWLFESIFHMPDRLTVLKQAARVLRPGGRLVLTDLLQLRISPGPRDARDAELADLMVGARVSADAYRLLLPQAGLRLDAAEDITEQVVARSLLSFLAQVREQRQRLVQECGADVVEHFETVLPRMAEGPAFGYLLVSADRPQTA